MNVIRYAVAVLGYAFRQNSLWYVYIVASLISIFFELGAILSLMPLAALAAGDTPASSSRSEQIFAAIGLPMTAQVLLLTFLILFSMRLITLFATQLLNAVLSRRLMALLATRSFENLTRSTPMKSVENKSIGTYITLVGDESFRASMIVTNLSNVFSQLALTILYYIAIAIYSTAAAMGILVFLSITGLALIGSFRYSRRLGDRQIAQSRAASSIFLDALNGLRSVRAYRAESYVSDTYRERMSDYVGTLIRLDVVSQAAKLGPAALLLIMLTVVVLLPGIGTSFLSDFAFLITLIMMMMRLFPILGQLLITAMRVAADLRVGRDVTALADHVPCGKAHNGAPLDAVTRIVFQNVSFSHDEKRVLDGFSAVFEAGKSYAIVGPSGVGKSTLFDLVLRFYDPDEGAIFINGIRTTDLDQAEIRAKVILSTQDVTIFNDTIGANVSFGLDYKSADIEAAGSAACVDEVTNELEEGYAAMLAYRGTNLSGGQRQRIGIARALVRNPDVLLLDECTSALDSRVRQIVVDKLLAACRDRLVIFITHDEWLAQRVDHVIDFSRFAPD